MALVEVENLWRTFPAKHKRPARGIGQPDRGVSFEVEKGEIFGLIGPDGAGKTTLIRVLCTLLKPQGGSGSINGWDLVKDFRQIRKHIGYMAATFSLYEDLTVEENMQLFATLFDTTITENYDLVKDIYSQIEPFRHRQAGQLSGGMKQKLQLSCALIHKPICILLDEPTTGVDPVSRRELWHMLKNLAQSGISIIVSTAYMDEATLCDRIALMQQGQIQRIDTPEGIVQSYKDRLYAVSGPNMLFLLHGLRDLEFVHRVEAFGDVHHVSVSPKISEEFLRTALVEYGFTDVKVSQIEPSVEDCFMAMEPSTAIVDR